VTQDCILLSETHTNLTGRQKCPPTRRLLYGPDLIK
jgi:hypothetical protein